MNVSGLMSKTAQATLLLTSYFSKASSENAKPLTNAEWGQFASWLKEKSTAPADLLVTDPKALLNGWRDTRISVERIVELLNRGHSLALAMEKWQRAGLWVVTRSDSAYPWRLKEQLKKDSPPVLFGCGNKNLLNAGGLAVVGSRNASEADLIFTEQVGVKAASEGIAVVSGGARGVDETAMLGAMNQGGVVIGVMADSLLKAATSSKWRKGLMDGNVVLVSPFYPEAGFNVGNAMARNKYIYCLAESSLVVHSGKKGGTLNGAEENLKSKWVPLWVKPTSDSDAANSNLVSKGGRWCDEDTRRLNISDFLESTINTASQVNEEQADLFSISAQPQLLADCETESATEVTEPAQDISIPDEQTNRVSPAKEIVEIQEPSSSTVKFYQLFVHELKQLARLPTTADELVERTDLNKSQLNDWLKRAEADGVVKKLNHPIRFQIVEKL